MVKRYTPRYADGHLVGCGDGDVVMYKDYAALRVVADDMRGAISEACFAMANSPMNVEQQKAFHSLSIALSKYKELP